MSPRWNLYFPLRVNTCLQKNDIAMPIENDHEFANNVYNNFMALFFNPEIAKRKALGLLNDDFTLYAAQVILFPNGDPNIIRLNDEVSAAVRLKPGVDHTRAGFWPTISEVDTFQLNETQFMNCGHVTMVLLHGGYQLSFDFQYNNQFCKEHLNIAEQFLNTSRYAIDNNHVMAFIDNSFSAIELLAKANLLLEANQNVSGKTNHNQIKQAFNNRFRYSETEFEVSQRAVFNRLSDQRSKARYLNGEVNISIGELNSIQDTVRKMYDALVERLQYVEN